jgi:three-Cys-motif partner protein
LSNYYFVDINPDYISALKRRADVLDGSASHKRYFTGDSNQEVLQILRFIDKKLSVNLALIDGFGVECNWPTVQLLASCQRMDLIILFPQGMSINRNLKQWAESESNALDAFFGTDEWRQIYRNAGGQANKCIRAFLDLYQRNLRDCLKSPIRVPNSRSLAPLPAPVGAAQVWALGHHGHEALCYTHLDF